MSELITGQMTVDHVVPLPLSAWTSGMLAPDAVEVYADMVATAAAATAYRRACGVCAGDVDEMCGDCWGTGSRTGGTRCTACWGIGRVTPEHVCPPGLDE